MNWFLRARAASAIIKCLYETSLEWDPKRRSAEFVLQSHRKQLSSRFSRSPSLFSNVSSFVVVVNFFQETGTLLGATCCRAIQYV